MCLFFRDTAKAPQQVVGVSRGGLWSTCGSLSTTRLIVPVVSSGEAVGRMYRVGWFLFDDERDAREWARMMSRGGKRLSVYKSGKEIAYYEDGVETCRQLGLFEVKAL